jgi:O-methyltransferase involved in polyketide biosynthesis
VSSSGAISPTAHYTGHVWYRNGLSHPLLATGEGRLMFDALAPAMRLARPLARTTLEDYLLARHRAIDALLSGAIAAGDVGQVIEIAAGLSPRGWRFVSGHPDLVYLEGDLPAMAARKRRALAAMGSPVDRHRVLDLDALRPDGRGSLASLAAELDRGRGTMIITEGLLGYLPPADVRGLWRRIAHTLSAFPAGGYLSDLHLGTAPNAAVRLFRVGLSAFVRGRVYLHFDTAVQAEDQLRACGFARASVRPAGEVLGDRGPRDAPRAHILEASTEPAES